MAGVNNMRIVADNAADRANLVASSTAGALAVSNLLTDTKSDVWRAIGKTERLTLAWAVAEAIACIALIGNFSPTTTMRVRTTNEAISTNLLKYSEQFDNAAWIKSRSNVIQNAPGIVAPDGSATVSKFCNNGIVDSNGYMRQQFACDGISIYFGSVFVFAGEITTAQLDLVENNGANFLAGSRCIIDLTTGATSTTGITYPRSKVINCGGGWYRIVVGGIPAAGVGEFRISLPADSTAGTGGFYVWGAQVEVGSLSSYYPSLNTFTSRASIGTYFDSTGTLQSAGVNEARMQYNPNNLSAPPHLLLEPSAMNAIRNNTMQGTVAGAWGTAASGPTNWVRTANATVSTFGFTIETVGAGIKNGIEYIRVRAYGTPSLTSNFYLRPESTQAVVANSGETWASSAFVEVVKDTGMLWLRHNLYGVNSSNVVMETAQAYTDPVAQKQALGGYRPQLTATFSDATVTAAWQQWSIGFTQGVPLDIEFLIGLPQLERDRVTSPVRTTNASVTRAVDNSTSATATRPLGYIDSWQSYGYDSGAVLACPAPAIKLRGWTAAQAASAYAYGGGAYARHWMPNEVQAVGLAVDIADQNNLQGYIEAARLVAGPYWSPAYNASDPTMTPVDTTELFRTDGGDQGADAGYIYRRVAVDLSLMPAADRAAFVNILRNSRAYPLLVSVFPGSTDLALERDHTVYGRRSKDSDVGLQYAMAYSTTVEIQEF